jgi:NAD(P)-dependent dehydrogenase (short-subunit alcohol dehydrogenase family)
MSQATSYAAGVGGALAGKSALVTGGGRGIGAAIARALSTAGARVTLVGRTEPALTTTSSDPIHHQPPVPCAPHA